VEGLDAEVVIQQDAGELIATFDNLFGDAKQQLSTETRPLSADGKTMQLVVDVTG
jgi:hypothetical protein